MKSNSEKKDLLVKYLADECTPAEIAEVYEWMASDENKHKLEELIDDLLLRQTYSLPPAKDNRKEAIWENIHENINQRLNNNPAKEHKVKPLVQVFSFRNIAAAVIILVGVFSTFYLTKTDETNLDPIVQPSVISEISTESGQKKDVVLLDGTKIKLNSSSSISFEKKFLSTAERKVTLVGEAYFDVAKDKSKPFIVNANGIEIKVLGTSFNVKTTSNNNKVYIALIEGKVLLKNQDNSIELTENEMGIADVDDKTLAKTNFDVLKNTGWKDGKIVFDNATYREVICELKEWFGVDFTLKGATPKGRITTVYDNESLSEVLEGLSFTYNFDYKINDDKVEIKFK